MADKTPFKVNRPALPTESARQLFNTENCFAKGGLTMGADGKPVLSGNCQVVQFGRNSRGNNCMFVCQTNLSEFFQRKRPVLASFVFNHIGQVIEFCFGNSAATPSWRTNVHDGTRASFGFQPPPPPPSPPKLEPLSVRLYDTNEQLRTNAKTMTDAEREELLLKKNKIKENYEMEVAEAAKAAKAARDAYDELIKTPTWGCTSVLKGPLDFIGCQRGSQYVSCVDVSADFNQQLDTSPEDLPKIKPHFKYDPVAKISTVGASATEYYDGYGFGNVGGNQGFQSFVVSDSNGRISTMETRQGSCPYPKPIPERLRASFPETNKKFKLMLMKGNASLRSEMKALKWLADTPLEFPSEIDSTFAARAFDWVHELSTKFEVPRGLSLSDAALTKMIKSTTQASVAAMHSPAMRESLLAEMTKLPIWSKQVFNSCKCTPMHHNPRCPNPLCPFRHAKIEEPGFEWPQLEFASATQEARLALEDEISGATRAEAAAAEAKQKSLAAAAAKQKEADAKREERNARAREATAQRKASAAAAKESAASASAAKSAVEPSAAAASAAPVRRRTTQASAEPEARGVKRSTDSAEQKPTPTRRRGRGGSKSNSKSKRRLRK